MKEQTAKAAREKPRREPFLLSARHRWCDIATRSLRQRLRRLLSSSLVTLPPLAFSANLKHFLA